MGRLCWPGSGIVQASIRTGQPLLVYSTAHPNFRYTEIIWKKTVINISRHTLWFVCFPIWNVPGSGFSVTHVNLMTSHCHSVGSCIALCVVSALNSWAIQSQACISAADYKVVAIFLESVLKIIFTENKMKWNKKWKYSNCPRLPFFFPFFFFKVYSYLYVSINRSAL